MRKSIFLSLLIALTTICSSCSDDDESGFRVPSLHFSIEDLSYTTNTNGTSAQLSGCADKSIYQVEFPSRVTYNGKSYAITSIGDSVFRNCSYLGWIAIPDKVTSIGDGTFAYTGMGWITIPSNMTSLGDSVFAGCTNLKEIYVRNSIPPAVGSGGFYQVDKSTCKLYVPIGSKDAYAAAEGWKEFLNIEESSKEPILTFSYGDLRITTNEDGTTAAVSGAHWCTKTLDIDSSVTYLGKNYTVTSIGSRAFRETQITSITLPSSVTSIGKNAFWGCINLTSITLPDTFTSVKDSVFYGCTKLQKIYLRTSTPPSVGVDKLLGIDKSSCKLYIPFGTREAYAAAAGWNDFLQIEETDMSPIMEFTVDNLKYISTTASTSASITGIVTNPVGQLTIPSNITYNGKSYTVNGIANSAFAGCTGLTSIEIPTSVTSIGEYAFSNCDLTSITIPSSVTSIEKSTFYECRSLNSITIPTSVTSIGSEAFRNCTSLTSITIPTSVTSIGEYAFSWCSDLTSITLPSSVTSIGSYAFQGCRILTSITIPSSVTFIGTGTFCYCVGLTQFVVENGNTAFIADDGVLFTKDKKIIVDFPSAKGKYYTIPSNVTSIGDYAFYDCPDLISVTLPSSVTSIGSYAFESCSGLQEFYVNNPMPPSVGSSLFWYVDMSTCKLYVPIGSKEAYAAADEWKDFMNIEEMSITEE